jgi:peptidoglycan/LPS O-acetylase OafA/YrhL
LLALPCCKSPYGVCKGLILIEAARRRNYTDLMRVKSEARFVAGPRSKTPKRIPSLDGMRAISIGLVIAFHLIGTSRLGGAFMLLGNLGVRIFFVISGFLITGLLMDERERTGKIHLARFYVRRALRIFPAFYVFLGAIGVCAAIGWIVVPKLDFLEAGMYIMNYFPGSQNSHYLRHIWSLSVEEQFYLLWPGVLSFAGQTRGITIAAAVIVIVPVLRLTYWLFFPGLRYLIDGRFETVCDALATGCLLAMAQRWLASQLWYNQCLRSPAFYLVPLTVLLDSVFLAPHPRAYNGIGITVLNVGIALSIDRWVRYPEGIVASALNSAPLRAIGVLSYSIYLWQEPFLDSKGNSPFQSFPFNLLAIAACSLCSFFLIERPLRRLRARL